MTNLSETLPRNLLIAALIILALGAAGCISQQPEIMKVNPVIDSNPLEGFYGKSEGIFTVIKGSIPEVKESLKEIIIEKAPQQSTFSIDDELNFVVFRGVFSSGGYGIDIDRVERQGNAFTVYATYIDPGEGMGVTLAFTQPAAIIPIGKLAAGDYEARLKVTRVIVEDIGRKVIETEKELSVFNFKVKTPEEGIDGNTLIPNIIIGVDSYNPPAYKGSSTLITLAIGGNNVTKGTEISLNYKTQIWLANGSWEENPKSVHLTPQQKPLVFQRTIKAMDQPERLYSNLTVIVDKKAVDGGYYVTVSGKGKGVTLESAIMYFKIGKGGKFPLPDKSVWNIGYIIPSTLSEEERAIGSSSLIVGFTDAPPLSEEEKLVAIAIASNDTSLKGKSYEITGVSSGFYDSQNYSGFFPVVTLDIGEQDKPGTVISYIIDPDEKKAIGTTRIPRKPVPQEPTMMKRPPYITAIITAIQPNGGAIGTNVVITGSGFTAKNNSVAFELMPDKAYTAGYKVGYINNLKSYDGKTIEFVIPKVLSACAFPLPENVSSPTIVCPAIGILFKSGTQTYPVFIINQNGTSNSVNFTATWGAR